MRIGFNIKPPRFVRAIIALPGLALRVGRLAGQVNRLQRVVRELPRCMQVEGCQAFAVLIPRHDAPPGSVPCCAAHQPSYAHRPPHFESPYAPHLRALHPDDLIAVEVLPGDRS